MVGHFGVHGADDRHVVDVLGGVLKDLADLDAAFAVLLELVGAGEGGAGLALRRQVGHRQFLAGVGLQRRLRVERVDVRGTAIHEEMDDVLRFAWEMRRLRR
jgi:hypothetical protein